MSTQTDGTKVALAAEREMMARNPSETATTVLDRICEPYRGESLEFHACDPLNPSEAHPHFTNYAQPHRKSALGILMAQAFAPAGLNDLMFYSAMLDPSRAGAAEASDLWYAEVEEPFRLRYDFF